MNQPILNKSASISISNIFKEAWQRIYGLKTSVFFVAIAYGVILILLREPQPKHQPLVLNLLENGLQTVFNFFALAILLTLTYQQATGSKPNIKLALSKCYNSISPIFGLGIVYSITVTLTSFIAAFGFIFLKTNFNFTIAAIAGIPFFLLFFYVAIMAIMFALPLILFKNQSITSAIALSFQATNHYFFKLLLTQIACWILIIVGIIPAGIGIIWALPLSWMVSIIWFREVFGL